MKTIVAAVFVLAAIGAAPAQQRSAEDRYIADRDRAIRQFDSGAVDDAKTQAEAKARAGLERQMRAIVGPVAPSGFGDGELNLSTLFKGDQGFGTLDGLAFRADERKREMIVTTRTLLTRWLAGHKRWWEHEAMPAEPAAAFRTEAFWNQAIDTDAHITPFATLPLDAQGAVAHAVVGGRSQDQTPNEANEVFVAAVKGERVFVAFAAFEPPLAVQSCTAEREAAERKVKALGEGARPFGKAAEALDQRIEAMSRKAEQDFIRCFGDRIVKEPRWGEVVRLAQELYGSMR
jgi:hypothetical protein